MQDSPPPRFLPGPDGLPLVTDRGRAYRGLERSKSPELADRVQALFEHLNGLLHFPDSAEGRLDQEHFNTLLRCVYPEILLDLADLLYAQHERPAVFLNFDHINLNYRRDRSGPPEALEPLNERMSALFRSLAGTLKDDPRLHQDPVLVRVLSEGYSYYLYQTRNFPWDDPLQTLPPHPRHPVVDVATGLVGFSLIHSWPAEYPALILTDKMPFIVQGLRHYQGLEGKTNIEVRQLDFADPPATGPIAGTVQANKFLHHLERPQRQRFLHWAQQALEPGGRLRILDTDLEYQILKASQRPEFHGRLIPGYGETLVEIEKDFCKNLVRDVEKEGYRLVHFDFHDYLDETDAYSERPGDHLSLQFLGFEIEAEKPG